jgi:hypothetical protein
MKKISEKTMPSRKRRVTVELEEGEEMLVIRKDTYYRLGDPLGDVVAAHVLKDAVQVYWSPLQQEWVR